METVLSQFDAEKFIRVEKDQAKEEVIEVGIELLNYPSLKKERIPASTTTALATM